MTMLDTNSPDYLTPNEVARLLKIAPVTVRAWAQKGLLRAYPTPGGHRRFLLRDIEQFAFQRGLSLTASSDVSLRLLVVEDDAQLGAFIMELLEDRRGPGGNKLITCLARDGFDAGIKLREFGPDVVLLDLLMPGLNGFEVCRRIKTDPITRAVRVIAMTGYPTAENVQEILNLGAERCLSKPLNQSALLEALGLRQGEAAVP